MVATAGVVDTNPLVTAFGFFDVYLRSGSLAWKRQLKARLAYNGKARLTLTVQWVRLLQKGLFLSGFIEFSLFCHL